MYHQPPLPTNIKIDSRVSLEIELNHVVERTIQSALTSPGAGILVTRHDQQTFTVEISAEVPFGVIAERDLWASST